MLELVSVEFKNNHYYVTYKTTETSEATYMYTKDAFVRMYNLFKQALMQDAGN